MGLGMAFQDDEARSNSSAYSYRDEGTGSVRKSPELERLRTDAMLKRSGVSRNNRR